MFDEDDGTEDPVKKEFLDRCWRLVRPRIGYEISGEVKVRGFPYGVIINFDTHLDQLVVYLDAGMYIEEVVYDDTKRPARWIRKAAEEILLPLLRQHMVLEDLADA